jgi:hypothetical protein
VLKWWKKIFYFKSDKGLRLVLAQFYCGTKRRWVPFYFVSALIIELEERN